MSPRRGQFPFCCYGFSQVFILLLNMVLHRQRNIQKWWKSFLQGLHSVVEVNIFPSQQEGSWFDFQLGPLCEEFAWVSSCSSVLCFFIISLHYMLKLWFRASSNQILWITVVLYMVLQVSSSERCSGTGVAFPTTSQQRMPNIYLQNDYPDTEDKKDPQCHFSGSSLQDSQEHDIL